MKTNIKGSKTPNLPLGPVEYAQRYQDQLNSILRLYFNQIDNITGALLGPNPNQAFNFAHISASDLTNQYAADNTPTAVKWGQLDTANGWTLTAPGIFVATYAAVYKLTYSLQFVNTDNAIHYVTAWLKVNGANLAGSATKFAIPSRKSATPGEEGFVCAYSEVSFVGNTDDEVEVYWATDKGYSTTGPVDGVYMLYEAVQTTPFAHPSIPSAVGSIVYLARKTT